MSRAARPFVGMLYDAAGPGFHYRFFHYENVGGIIINNEY